MNLERQYHEFPSNPYPVIMDKNQTLLAIESAWETYMYSMETGMLIYKYDGVPIKFITMKNNFERLFIRRGHERKLVDPYYQVYDEINISSDFNDTSVMTNLNRKIFIDNGKVCITNGIDENKLQQLSDKTTYRNSIYTLSTFKIIQSMLNEIINRVDIKKVAPSYPEEIVLKDEVEIEDIGLCKIVLYNENNYDHMRIETDGYNLEVPICICGMLSFRLLNNQDWVIIDMKGISIYTFGNGFTYRYFWNNNEWNDIYENFKKDCGNHYDINFTNTHYKSLIERILRNEFDDSKHSIPITKFVEEHENEIIEDIINDNFVTPKFETKMLEKAIEENWNVIVYKIVINNLSPRFGNEILKIAIKKKCDHIVQQIIELIQDYSESYMTIISLNLPEFWDHYPDNIIKYISRTSFILSPYCYNIKYSKNTSLYSYTDFIYIKESNMKNNYFKSISTMYEWLIQHLRIEEEIQVISFIVPFPKICVYQDDFKNDDETENNHNIKSKIITILKKMITGLKIIMMIPKSNSIWNKFLNKPKSILFCNIDSNNFYNWWNFAAIIDFKWKTFGRVYYYLNWLFYTVFHVCYALASTLEQKSIPDLFFTLLFIISIIFGSIFLIFEIRYLLWDYKIYLNDIWNLFDVGAYLLPIITSIFWLINKSQPPWLMAISIILLSFKFLLFFRVFKSFGIYFAIIIGVAKKVFPFLVLLFFIILGYAQAFFIILRSNSINDDNDPQNLATKYDFVNSDGTINNTTSIIQEPDSNTNLFNWFPTSLLAVYNLLTGDSGSLSSFTYREHSIMTILLATFTFFTVIYLMNLFIGLLNLAIEDYNKEEEFLLQKAQIIMEIGIFYMLPWQRNNNKWFPDWIYYDIPVTEIRKLINAIDNEQTVFIYPPIISEKLRKLVVLTNEEEQNNKLEKQIEQTKDEFTKQNIELKQHIKEELTKQNVELKQQMERIMKYIGIEQDNENEEEQDNKEQDNKEEQDNELEQIEQTKEELLRQNFSLKQQMDKLSQQMENIMELLIKRN
ncbi:hypothetical protein RhiirA4_450354 [Rhizophagus irregularis]|uniref:Ion transport domain-containing protein n=1 Tax=Rhizophagus irregularis TaxID=588596 RepID=A0A2I1FSY8_9GLOM|nr:hypothetical protein RhiirA4_450354 [Rhizophagus irregularis]